ncbi:MAG: glycosyltransferase family 4 protein, partial [Burkholderiales bacterium]
MLVISEVWRDPRVEREARALAEAGFEVEILFPDYFSHIYPGGPVSWGERIAFSPLPAETYKYIFGFPYLFGRSYLDAAVKRKPFAFHCHDLNTALVGLAAARITGAHCICDFHEWYSENVSWDPVRGKFVPHHFLKRRIFRWAEQLALKQATGVITVCDSIARELTEMSGDARQVLVVKNTPRIPDDNPLRPHANLRTSLGIDRNLFIVLYSGGTGPSRYLEPIIEALAYAPNAVLVIRGPGIEVFGDHYRRVAKLHGVESRVFCLPPVPSDEVVPASAGADAGIWTLENLCKNFSYALPNKIFEYLAAGLPVLAADYPEVRGIIDKYAAGECFDPNNPKSIADAINRLAENPEAYGVLRKNAAAALADLRSVNEWSKLVHLYTDLANDVQRPEFLKNEGSPRARGRWSGGRLTTLARRMTIVLLQSITLCALALLLPLRAVRKLFTAGGTFSLWTGAPIVNMANNARAERLLGCDSRSLVTHTYYITDAFDYDLSKWRSIPVLGYLVAFVIFVWVCLRVDRLHFYCDRGILPSHRAFTFNFLELRIYRWIGIPVLLWTYGADVRSRAATRALGEPNCCTDCTRIGEACICNEPARVANMKKLSELATAIFSMGDMIEYTPGSRNDLFFWPVDLALGNGDKYQPAYPRFDGARNVRIVHAPNHRMFKGTRFLQQAVSELQNEGVPVELILVEKIPNV